MMSHKELIRQYLQEIKKEMRKIALSSGIFETTRAWVARKDTE